MKSSTGLNGGFGWMRLLPQALLPPLLGGDDSGVFGHSE
jgi:hypothetical protein